MELPDLNILLDLFHNTQSNKSTIESYSCFTSDSYSGVGAFCFCDDLEEWKKLHSAVLRNYFESYDTIDKKFKSDYNIIREHIIFAYGVKNGYVKLSREYKKFKVMQECYHPYFQLNFDHLYFDGWNFSTQHIYDNWKMDKWMHLLPQKA